MKNHNELRRLTELHQQITAKIRQILGGQSVGQLLGEIGIQPGDDIELVRQAPFGGPIHIRCNGHDAALSRNLAMKILVEAPTHTRIMGKHRLAK